MPAKHWLVTTNAWSRVVGPATLRISKAWYSIRYGLEGYYVVFGPIVELTFGRRSHPTSPSPAFVTLITQNHSPATHPLSALCLSSPRIRI